MNKVILNPKFSRLSDFINQLPDSFATAGQTVYQARNVIKVFEKEGFRLNVKSYHIPIFINQIIYSFLRPTKARRAYEYAMEVRRRGVEPPEPVAYIECRRFGLLRASYFVSIQCDMPGIMRTFLDLDVTNEGKLDLIEAFARYSARLHESQILHVDYSPGNILFEKKEDGYHFSLVDINRMHFGTVDMPTGCHNFARLCGNEEFFRLLAHYYAQERGFDEAQCLDLILRYRNEDRKKRQQKWRIIK